MKIRQPLISLALSVTAAFTGGSARGATTSWLNATSGNWTVGSNWDLGVPGVADTASLTNNSTSYSVDFSGTSRITGLTMTNGSGKLTTLNILSGSSLTTTGGITNTGAIHVSSNAAYWANDNVNGAGIFYVDAGGTLQWGANGSNKVFTIGAGTSTISGTLKASSQGNNYIQLSGGAILNVNGGTVISDSINQGMGNSAGIINVTNSGSVTVRSGQSFQIGSATGGQGYGTTTAMNVNTGGTVTNFGTLDIAMDTGSLSKNGIAALNISDGSWAQIGVTTVGTARNGSINLSSTGAFTTSSNTFVGGTVAPGALSGAATASGLLSITGGIFTAHNISNNATVTVGNAIAGTLTLSGGSMVVDALVASQGANSTVTFNGGTLKTKATTIATGSVFTVGNGTSAASLILNGGTHSFANGLVISNNASLNYNATSDTALTLGTTLAFSGAATTLGGTIGATGGVGTSSAQITTTGNATSTGGALSINVYGLPTVTPATGTFTLLHGGGATNTLNNFTSIGLGTVFNNTNWKITGGSLANTATDITVGITSATALTSAFWTGTGTTGITKVWTASDGNATSNWATASGGAVQGLIPTAVDLTIVGTTVSAVNSTLGSDMTIKSLTIADTNGLSLNADGYTLTITPASSTAGITVNSGVAVSTIAANVALGAAQTWTNNSTNALTVSGMVTGSSNLTTAGSGTVILSGANAYTGNTTVSAGVLNIQNWAALGSTANGTSVTSGAALQIQNNIFVGTEALTINGGGISNTGALRNISGTNYWAGGVTLGSTARINSDSGLLTITGSIGISSGMTLTLGGAGAGTVTGSLPNNNDFSGVNLIKDGAGTWTLNNNNGFKGKVIVQNGTLSFLTGSTSATTDQGLGGNANLDLGVASTSSGTLNYTGAAGTLAKTINVLGNGSDTIQNSGSGALTLSGSLVKNNTKLTLSGGSYGIIVTGIISGGTTSNFNSDLNVTAGTTTINTAGTYTGPTNITNAGTLVSGAAGVLPAGTVMTIGSASDGAVANTYNLGGFNQTIAALNSVSNGGSTNTNTVTNTGTSTLTLSGNNSDGNPANGTFGGVIGNGSGTTSLTVTGGTQTLLGTNTYSGATLVSAGTLVIGGGGIKGTSGIAISAGSLALAASDVLPSAAPMTLSGGTLNAQTFANTLGALTLSGNSSITLGIGGSLTFADSSASIWGNGLTIDISGFVSASSLRFGSTDTGLTVSQLTHFTSNGYTSFGLDTNGYLIGSSPEPQTWVLVGIGLAALIYRRRRNGFMLRKKSPGKL